MKKYKINEVFCSLQGEGLHAGTKSVFLRFAGCNLTCSRINEAGFDCDTEFVSSSKQTFADIRKMVLDCWGDDVRVPRVILTGGEPTLQVDDAFAKAAAEERWEIAVETNGTRLLPCGSDDWWISVSPKSAEHTLRIQRANELRYVRNHTQDIPHPRLVAGRLYLSPAWSDEQDERDRNLSKCIALIKKHSQWSLSTQQHKLWRLP